MYALGVGLSWAVLCLGGFDLPVSIPPQPETPLLAKIAPEDCLFYMSFAGTTAPRAESSNQLEQLLAEEDVQKAAVEIERMITEGLTKAFGRLESPPYSAEDSIDMAKLLLSRPTAVYISSVKKGAKGWTVRGGAAFQIGKGNDGAKAKLEDAIGKLLPDAESVKIGDQKWQQAKPLPDVTVVWGVRHKYFLIGIGDGEIEAMQKRARGEAPKWLTKLSKDLSVDRPAMIAYVNAKKATAAANASKVADVLGLTNVTAVRLITGLDETGFVSKTDVAIDGKPRGIFQLLAAKPLAATDFASIPRNVKFAAVTKFDFATAFDLCLLAVEKSGEAGAKKRMLAGLDGFKQQIGGVDLRQDILQSLGDRWIVASCVSDSPCQTVVSVSLKDSKKFAAAYMKIMGLLEKNLREQQQAFAGFGPSLSKTRVVGREIYTLTLPAIPNVKMPIAPSWCATEKELIFSPASQTIVAYLSNSTPSESLAKAPEVTKLLGQSPAPSHLTYCNLPMVFGSVYSAMRIAAPSAVAPLAQLGVTFDPAIFPPGMVIEQHLLPEVTFLRRTPSGILLVKQTTLPGVGAATAVPVVAALLLPAVQAARKAAGRARAAKGAP